MEGATYPYMPKYVSNVFPDKWNSRSHPSKRQLAWMFDPLVRRGVDPYLQRAGPCCSFVLGPRLLPFYPFLGEGSPTKIDYRKKGTLMEDLDWSFTSLVWLALRISLAGFLF